MTGALLLAIIMPLAPVQAADNADDASVEALREDVANLNRELQEFTAERRERLMTDIEDVLDSIDARIAALESRLRENRNKVDQLTRAQAQTALASLRRERARVTEWYQRMEDSANFTWESMKEGFNEAFDQLSEDWESAEQAVRDADEQQ
jgi:predicted RNase H-like nuclease (RuvC/YqgF family)